MAEHEPLLASVRVLDLTDGDADTVGRLLADLGADVLKIEPPTGSPGRTKLPSLDGASIPFGLHNYNKRSVVLDPTSAADRTRLIELAGSADIVIDSALHGGMPGRAAQYGTSGADLADRFGHLVAMSISDFGTSGPYESWQATDAVLYAMSSALSRSGPAVGTPVLPPDGIASATAAVQAVWALLVAYINRLRCGVGDYIDFSRFDAVVLALDPPFGTQGQAASARSRTERWRGRPRNQDAYPIFACRDGYVRICVLAPRQWRGMRAWLGEPEEFQDPKFDTLLARAQANTEISALIAALFAGKTMAELVGEGQSRGVPIAEVLTPSEALECEHLNAVGALGEVELAPGVHVQAPTGYWVIDGTRAGYRAPAPAVGSSEPRWSQPCFTPDAVSGDPSRPLAGLRIIDLGVIVAGGELSRLFGDLGAEVIKLESAAYPDGLRQSRPGQAMSDTFARARRNNIGLGLELRTPEGKQIFEELVARSDAVFANFKPGTLATLGFSYERLIEINPRIILVESSAFGDTGPWSARMGYGPLVRASTGVTRMWTSPQAQAAVAESGRHPFYDATTIFPDHVVGRISAIGALAAFIRRRRTGLGARVHVSQAEAVINQLDTAYVSLAAEAHGGEIIESPAIHRVLSCAGEDEWCVVSIRDDADRAALAAAIGVTTADALAELAEWTAARTPADAVRILQAAGVPAGAMHRADDVYDDPQLRSRNVLVEMHHPLFDVSLPCESGPAPYRRIRPADLRPAPLPGADTRRICSSLLGIDDSRIQRLIEEGVLFTDDTDRKVGT